MTKQQKIEAYWKRKEQQREAKRAEQEAIKAERDAKIKAYRERKAYHVIAKLCEDFENDVPRTYNRERSLTIARECGIITDKDDVEWFSTESGTHIPLNEGQTKAEACKEFFAEKDAGSIKATPIRTQIPNELLNANGGLCFSHKVNGVSYEIGCNRKTGEGIGIYEHASAKEIEENVQMLRDFCENNPVTITCPGSKLLNAVEDGRYKTQFETGTSRGIYDPDLRTRVEKELMGVPVDIKPSERPAYGAFGFPSGASGYGDCQIVLKDSVKQRCTVSASDSLGFSESITPSAYSDIQGYSIRYNKALGNEYQPYTGNKYSHGYVEAQIHGGVKLSDIRYVKLSQNSAKNDMLVKAIEKAGISYEVKSDD